MQGEGAAPPPRKTSWKKRGRARIMLSLRAFACSCCVSKDECMYVCMYVGVCVCLCVFVSMAVCLYVSVSCVDRELNRPQWPHRMYDLGMYVCIYVCVYVCLYVCLYVSMYVCIYIYMCVYVCLWATCMHDTP